MTLNLLTNKQNEHLAHLDWHEIIHPILSHTHFEQSKKILSGPLSFLSKEEIESQYDKIDYLQRLIRNEEIHSLLLPITFLPTHSKFKNVIQKTEKGSVLSISEINLFMLLHEAYYDLFPHLRNLDFSFIDKASYPRDIFTLNKEFRSFVDKSGTPDYNKHPVLSLLYDKMVKIESLLRERLKGLISSSEMKNILRYDQYDVINDHFVIPIKSDSYSSKLGRIIAHSDSGMTLFIEPYSIKELGHERLTLLAQIDEEIFKICQGYCQRLVGHTHIFEKIEEIVVLLDILIAKAKYAFQRDFIRPKMILNNRIKLKGIYHPLISNPIKNNLTIEKNKGGLIISGPNTGGKTVLLKTIAIIHLFPHFGLFIPASYAELTYLKNVFYFSNDHQNITEGLSSFSAEVKNYLQLLEEINDDSLILIDEIFNSTSSEEASALALGLFQEIAKNHHHKIIVSTHHQMLKTYMHKNQNFISCHVGLDTTTNRPTYKIIFGSPGSSLALKIFEKLSQNPKFTANVLNVAESVLDKKHQTYENLLHELSQKQIKLDTLITQNNRLKKDLEHQYRKMEGVFHLQLTKKIQNLEDKFHALIEKSQKMANEFKDSKVSPNIFVKSIKEAKEHFIRLKERTIQGDEKKNIHPNNRPLKKPKNIVVGEKYFSQSLKSLITVFSLGPREAQVKKGNFTIRVPIEDLYLPENTNNSASEISVNISRSTSNDKIEYDLRGLKLEEFQQEIESILLSLSLGEIPFVNIIHGHGVLKNWLRSSINKGQDFAIEMSESGNDGESKIILKK